MNRLFYIFLIAITSTAFAADKSWLGFDEGLEKSLKEKKPMLVDFYTDWCHWCKVMDEKTFNEEKVKAKLTEKFVTVRLNAEDRQATATYKGNTYTNVQLTQAFGVTGFPTLAFMDAQGEIITTIPGYVPAENFIHILSYIDQKMYEQKMPFDEFVRLQEAKEK